MNNPLDTLGLEADKGSINLEALLVAVNSNSRVQSGIITARGSVSVENSGGTVSAGARLDIGGEGLDGKVLDVDARSSIGVGGINAGGVATSVKVASVADSGVGNGNGRKGGKDRGGLEYHVSIVVHR
ncbi:hypothetical protein N7493_010047 [Penicillium malachiteum]|uniref:Uncharacterized protein n=1 Tax=Penicillium malachiteum TaxID=1324776 RepID=A0AAD6HE14_9EURO|nr:hypothetical protein N7493_010047 [Penicillium malachiteum]